MTASAHSRESDRWISVDPDSLIFLIPLGVLGVLGWVWGWAWLWAAVVTISCAVAAFFRDPPRRIPGQAGAVVSPADGKVVAVEPNHDPARGPAPGTKIVIFLSVLNCHINRCPVEGRVETIRHRKGRFLNALDPASSERNESNWIHLQTAWGRVTVRQIAGLIARRIVCRVKEGQELARGERIGLIRFGSRTELYLPQQAQISVRVGQSVKGGRDLLACFPADEAHSSSPSSPAASSP